MNRRFLTRSSWRFLFSAALCLAASPAWSQVLFYATSSATLANNTIDYVAPGGAPLGSILSATGAGANNVFRCTAMAVDASAQLVFLLDAQSQEIWSMNLDGTGLTPLVSVAPATPSDLALDTNHQQIYFTTSSYTQGDNTIQSVSYSGAGGAVLFTAGGSSGNGVSRCTALALDLLHSQIFFSDAGANALWSIPLGGSVAAASVESNLPAVPLDLALDATNQFVYYVTSSTIQTNNTVERVGYGGTGNTLLFTAPGAGGVQRCSALEFDPVASKIYLADAGASALWSLNSDGTGIASVEAGVLSTPRRVRLLPALPDIVFNFNDSGPGSLRQAIADVGIYSSIVFSNGLFANGPGVVQLTTISDTTFGPSAIVISNNVSIGGPGGANGLVIARSAGAPAMRLFYIAPGGSLTLSNVTLTNGLSQGGEGGSGDQRGGGGGGGGGMGGAVFNYGTLALINSTLVGNQAVGGAGGGTNNVVGGGGDGSGGGGGGMGGDGGPGGQLSTGGTGGGPTGGAGGTGTAGGTGGGTDGGGGGGGSSTTSGDGSGPGGGGGFGGGGGGGGAYNTVGFGGAVGGNGGAGGFGGGGGGPGSGTPGGTIGGPGFGGGASGASDNTGNLGSAGGGGAGMGGAVFSVYGIIGITNCTFSGNQALGGAGGGLYGSLGSNGMGFGGAIFNVDSSLSVLNATFAYNQADQGGGGIFDLGDFGTASVFLRNTILADTLSSASDYCSSNLDGTTNTDLGNNNLIQVNNGFAGGLVSTSDPLLTPLQNNGGPTLTHALLNQSPAINTGDNTALPATDQRGYPRIVDGLNNGQAIADLGAVEDGLVLLTAVPQTPQEFVLNGFELSLTGETNRDYVIEYSTDLVNWTPVSINLVPPQGTVTLFDASAGTSPANRVYRAYAAP